MEWAGEIITDTFEVTVAAAVFFLIPAVIFQTTWPRETSNSQEKGRFSEWPRF